MDLMTKTREKIGAAEPGPALTPTVLDEAGILIVCADDSDTETLRAIFREAKFTLECAKSITAGCEAAASGRFQVVLSVPLLNDGSWRRLIDLAHHQDLNFEVVLLARNFDLNQWAEALKDGAFDVLDTLHELPKAAEVATHALGAGHLKRFRSRHNVACTTKVERSFARGAGVGG